MRKGPVLIFSFFCSFGLFGQNYDSPDSVTTESHHSNWKKIALTPAILVGTGLLTTIDNNVLDKWDFRNARNELSPNFHTRADNYIQFVPIVAVYGFDAFGVKSKSDLINRTVLLVKSEILMTIMVFPLKSITNVARPDGSTSDAFPSGHTAEAFLAATFFHKEYGKKHPWLSVLAYTTATGVGVLRVMNNRHWISDVLVGAGIGILSTNLAYLTHQYKWGRRRHNSTASIVPTFGQNTAGLYVSIPLR